MTVPIVTAMVVVAVSAVPVALVPLPVTVSMKEPAAAVLAADTVNTLLVAVAGLETNVAVTPVGRPDAANVTGPVKPPVFVTVMVSVALAPCATPRVAAVDDRVNAGLLLLPPPTVSATVTV